MPRKAVRPKVYLAGPEVFLRDAVAVGAAKVEICARHGLDGRFPLDAKVELDGLALAERAYAIFRANEGLMRNCDALIANLTPFRGPGMDAGTAYEIGFVRGLGRPVFGYTNSHLLHFDRVRKFDRKPLRRRSGADPAMDFEDSERLGVEQFGLAENLMIDSAIHESDGAIVQGKTKRRNRYHDLTAFEICVRQVSNILNKK